MDKKRFTKIIMISLCIIFNMSSFVFASGRSEVIKTFKAYFREKNSCVNFDEYKKVVKKYGTAEMVKKVESSGGKMLPEKFKEAIFNIARQTWFDINELIIKNVTVNDIEGTATLIYGREGQPDFEGKVTLIKENGGWKIDKESTKNGR